MVLAFRWALVKPHTTSIFSCRPTCGNTQPVLVNGWELQWNREIFNTSLPPHQFDKAVPASVGWRRPSPPAPLPSPLL